MHAIGTLFGLVTQRMAWVALCACAAGAAAAADGPAGDGYRLIWADEFDRDGPPDPDSWDYEHGFVRNRELQWYQPANAACRDGYLVIEARRESRPNPQYQAGSRSWQRNRETIEYTSACLVTRGKHAWQYGRFEIRARIPASDGLWPAIWFLGVEGAWPFNGEIDLMEYYDGSILANACWGSDRRWQPTWDSAKIPLQELGGPDWDQAFHLWRMEWNPQRIDLYLDDRLLNSIDLTRTRNPEGQSPPNPFQQPHFLLLNLAVGGTRGGNPEATPFPARFVIDYVRVYQKDPPDSL